jgi:hypothetical protein
MLDITYKKCSCPLEDWEVIVVDHEDAYNDESVIFHHCANCGEDFAVTDFYTGAILFELDTMN